jgi:hypothetical protein
MINLFELVVIRAIHNDRNESEVKLTEKKLLNIQKISIYYIVINIILVIVLIVGSCVDGIIRSTHINT